MNEDSTDEVVDRTSAFPTKSILIPPAVAYSAIGGIWLLDRAGLLFFGHGPSVAGFIAILVVGVSSVVSVAVGGYSFMVGTIVVCSVASERTPLNLISLALGAIGLLGFFVVLS